MARVWKVGRLISQMGIPIRDGGDGRHPGGWRTPWEKRFGEGICGKKEARVKGQAWVDPTDTQQ